MRNRETTKGPQKRKTYIILLYHGKYPRNELFATLFEEGTHNYSLDEGNNNAVAALERIIPTLTLSVASPITAQLLKLLSIFCNDVIYMSLQLLL